YTDHYCWYLVYERSCPLGQKPIWLLISYSFKYYIDDYYSLMVKKQRFVVTKKSIYHSLNKRVIDRLSFYDLMIIRVLIKGDILRFISMNNVRSNRNSHLMFIKGVNANIFNFFRYSKGSNNCRSYVTICKSFFSFWISINISTYHSIPTKSLA